MDFKESSQSSGISLADISINTNLSDSELDDEDTVLGSNKSSETNKQFQPQEILAGRESMNSSDRLIVSDISAHKSTAIRNNMENIARPYREVSEEVLMSPVMPLGDVRFALQENCNFLRDQNLLSDLLQSLDEKLAKSSQGFSTSNSSSYRPDLSMSYGPPNKDQGPNLLLGSAGSEHFHSDVLQPGGTQGKANPCELPTKHVTFNKLEPRNGHMESEPLTRQTLEVMQSHQILQHLSSLRWKLAGWEVEGLDPPADERSSLMFVHRLLYMLQVHQEQKKYLKEQLLTSERNLKSSNEELHVLKKLNEKRDTRLREADAQIGILQRDWMKSYEASCHDTRTLQLECDKLKKERNSLQEEKEELEKKLQKYADLTRDYQLVKSSLEEAQDRCAASRRQTAETAEENARLYQNLQETEKHLREVKEIKLVNMKHELDEANSKLDHLEKSHQKLIRTNAHLSDDLRMLHDQHRKLLQDIVLEAEEKETALKEKEVLEEQVKDLASKIDTTKAELHKHYQTQVREMVSQKSDALQEQLGILESGLKQNLAEQLDAQRETHRHALTKIQEGHSKEIQDLGIAHASKVSRLEREIHRLQKENTTLKTQHQGIITAMSSILTSHQVPHNTKVVVSQQMPDFPWNGNIASTSTPINTRPVSPCYENNAIGATASKSGSRPTSGKSGQSGNRTRVPGLRRISSSSSESGNSVFQDGKQTVRHYAGGSMLNLSNNKEVNCCSRSENTGMTGGLTNDPVLNSAEPKFRSLPDLQGRQDVFESNSHTRKGVCLDSFKDVEFPPYQRENNGNKGRQEKPYPAFRKIYRASEILQNDDEVMDDFSNLMQVDFKMSKLIEELKSIKSSAKTSDNDAPTHDTSFDQDPANITLRKLNQVSTVLSQYVNQTPGFQ